MSSNFVFAALAGRNLYVNLSTHQLVASKIHLSRPLSLLFLASLGNRGPHVYNRTCPNLHEQFSENTTASPLGKKHLHDTILAAYSWVRARTSPWYLGYFLHTCPPWLQVKFVKMGCCQPVGRLLELTWKSALCHTRHPIFASCCVTWALDGEGGWGVHENFCLWA